MQKKLGLFTLTSLVAGNMVGSGIFMLPASLARVGSISLLSWIFTISGAILLALVFSRMSLLVPKAGGPYAYARAGFGNFIGFQTACIYWIAVWLGNCSVALALVGYLRFFFPVLAYPLASTSAAIAFIWLFTWINIRGVYFVGIIQLVTTILKLIPLLLIGIFGWFYFHPDYITHAFNVTHKSNFSAFSYAATLIFWAFVGLESATVPADAVHNPKRDIPLATLLGTLIAAVVYLVSASAIMGVLPAGVIADSSSPFAAAAQAMFGGWGGIVVAAGVVISCLGGLNGWILVQGHVSMAIADDKFFPQIFAKRNRANVPAAGMIITGICMTLALLATMSPSLVEQFQLLITIVSVTSLMAYFYTAIASIILTQRGQYARIKHMSYMALAFLAALYAFWAMFGAGKEMMFYVSMMIFITALLYILNKNRNIVNHE